MTSLFRSLLPLLLSLCALPALAAFTDNGDGTITDTVTGLMWDKCAWGQTWTSNTCSASTDASPHSWSAALGVAVTANAAAHRDHGDWRLPNAKELESLVDIGKASGPTIDDSVGAIPNTPSGLFWTSTTYAPGPANAWYVASALAPTTSTPTLRAVPTTFDSCVADSYLALLIRWLSPPTRCRRPSASPTRPAWRCRP